MFPPLQVCLSFSFPPSLFLRFALNSPPLPRTRARFYRRTNDLQTSSPDSFRSLQSFCRACYAWTRQTSSARGSKEARKGGNASSEGIRERRASKRRRRRERKWEKAGGGAFLTTLLAERIYIGTVYIKYYKRAAQAREGTRGRKKFYILYEDDLFLARAVISLLLLRIFSWTI